MSAAGRAPARDQFPVFGGIAVLLVADPDAIGAAGAAVRAETAAIDAACSRFRADSELSRVNAAAGRTVPVGELFAQALDTALRAAELTAGDVDPTCGAALLAAGYDRDFGLLRVQGATVALSGSAPAPGWRSVRWDRDRGLVRLPAGARLDFGATAKALAADRAARRVYEECGSGALVSLGGDVAVHGPAPRGGWRVRVTDDHRCGPDAPGQTIALSTGGLATSSTTVRRWRAGPADLHHIVDPGTGRPADSCWRTVSVAAACCVDANVAATAALLRGRAASGWLAGLRLPARLVRHDGSVATVAGWPVETALSPDG